MKAAIYYRFTATGKTPNGIRVSCSGYVRGPAGYPAEVLYSANACVLKQFPGLILNGTRGTVTQLPTIQALKGIPKCYQPKQSKSAAKIDAEF